MDQGQSEWTDKIRSAIKKKLIEINAFVDDELPTYIMISVANKRSKAHMEKDLTLFLGKDTADFTNWLWELVNNLKVTSKAKQNEKVLKSDDETTRKDHSDEDADVLDYNLGEQGDFDQDENSLDRRPMLPESVKVSIPLAVPTTVSRGNALSKNVNRRKVSPKAKVYPVQAVATVHPSSMLKSAPLKTNHELNPIEPDFTGNVSSVVRVSQRNARPTLQKNKLLLRGVDDASKSVLDGTDLDIDSQPSFVKEKPDSPHFIVKLDGVDSSSFKRKFSEYSDENMEVGKGLFSTDVNVIDTMLVKKQKIVERCKYWPACKNSENCTYHHPAKPCRSFPDCKYGYKCLYIHPNCIFDSLCTRKDCPFTHASKRTFQARPVPVNVRKPKVICKFYPKCTVKNCPFIHPKLCRYGAKCRLPACSFSHLNIPLRSQLKWKANT